MLGLIKRWWLDGGRINWRFRPAQGPTWADVHRANLRGFEEGHKIQTQTGWSFAGFLPGVDETVGKWEHGRRVRGENPIPHPVHVEKVRKYRRAPWLLPAKKKKPVKRKKARRKK